MSANAFDTLTAARDLEAAGIEADQAEAVAAQLRAAAEADRGDGLRCALLEAIEILTTCCFAL